MPETMDLNAHLVSTLNPNSCKFEPEASEPEPETLNLNPTPTPQSFPQELWVRRADSAFALLPFSEVERSLALFGFGV